jgi:hypothetical protein
MNNLLFMNINQGVNDLAHDLFRFGFIKTLKMIGEISIGTVLENDGKEFFFVVEKELAGL